MKKIPLRSNCSEVSKRTRDVFSFYLISLFVSLNMSPPTCSFVCGFCFRARHFLSSPQPQQNWLVWGFDIIFNIVIINLSVTTNGTVPVRNGVRIFRTKFLQGLCPWSPELVVFLVLCPVVKIWRSDSVSPYENKSFVTRFLEKSSIAELPPFDRSGVTPFCGPCE